VFLLREPFNLESKNFSSSISRNPLGDRPTKANVGPAQVAERTVCSLTDDRQGEGATLGGTVSGISMRQWSIGHSRLVVVIITVVDFTINRLAT
jgi:hypothetical protein